MLQNGAHGDYFDAPGVPHGRRGFGVARACGQQAGGNDQRPADDGRGEGGNPAFPCQLGHAAVQAGRQFVRALPCPGGGDLGVRPADGLLLLEVLGAVVPMADFRGQPFPDRGRGLVHVARSARPDLVQMGRHEALGGVAQRGRFDGGARDVRQDDGQSPAFRRRRGPVVEMRRGPGLDSGAVPADFDESDLAGDGAPGAVAVGHRLPDGVLQGDQGARFAARVGVVDQGRSPFEEGAVAFENDGERGVEQRVARADELRDGFAGHVDTVFVEGQTLVAGEDRVVRSAVPAHDGRHVAGFVAFRLPLAQAAAEAPERLDEERRHEVRLQPARRGPVHAVADFPDARGVQAGGHEGAGVDQGAQRVAVQRPGHAPVEPGAHLGPVAVPDGFEQQVAERCVVESEPAQHVEDLAAQGLARFVELLQQPAIDRAFARPGGDEIPAVADLGLADAVDAAEALFQAVRVPRQVVVDHQVGALQVDPLARGVGRQEHGHVLVLGEPRLHLPPRVPPEAAVDDRDRAGPAQQRPDPFLQVGQRVTVFGEDDQLARPAGEQGSLQQAGQFVPFPVQPRGADAQRRGRQVAQAGDLGLQFGNRPGRGRSIDDAGFRVRQFFVRCVVEVGEVGLGQARHVVPPAERVARAPQAFRVPAPLFQARRAAPQRLVDRLGRRGEPALQHRQGEADGPFSSVVGEPVGAVELSPHVFRDAAVQVRLVLGQRIGRGVRPAFGKERAAVEREEVFLDHPPHQVRRIDRMHPGAEASLEAVRVDQGQKELEVFFPAVVGRRRQEEKVPREGGEPLAQPVAPGPANLAAPEGRAHLVRLVAHDQVPVGGLERGLQGVVPAQRVEATDRERVFREPGAGSGGSGGVGRHDLERQGEPPREFVPPLLDEIARAHDQTPPHVPAHPQLLDQQPGHDRLSRARVVRQHEAERLAGQQRLVHRGDLVRQRVQMRGVDGQERVEQGSQTNAVRLGDEPEQVGVAVEGPRPAGVRNFGRAVGRPVVHAVPGRVVAAGGDAALGDAPPAPKARRARDAGLTAAWRAATKCGSCPRRRSSL